MIAVKGSNNIINRRAQHISPQLAILRNSNCICGKCLFLETKAFEINFAVIIKTNPELHLWVSLLIFCQHRILENEANQCDQK